MSSDSKHRTFIIRFSSRLHFLVTMKPFCVDVSFLFDREEQRVLLEKLNKFWDGMDEKILKLEGCGRLQYMKQTENEEGYRIVDGNKMAILKHIEQMAQPKYLIPFQDMMECPTTIFFNRRMRDMYEHLDEFVSVTMIISNHPGLEIEDPETGDWVDVVDKVFDYPSTGFYAIAFPSDCCSFASGLRHRVRIEGKIPERRSLIVTFEEMSFDMVSRCVGRYNHGQADILTDREKRIVENWLSSSKQSSSLPQSGVC